jgi:hypothetical protein
VERKRRKNSWDAFVNLAARQQQATLFEMPGSSRLWRSFRCAKHNRTRTLVESVQQIERHPNQGRYFSTSQLPLKNNSVPYRLFAPATAIKCCVRCWENNSIASPELHSGWKICDVSCHSCECMLIPIHQDPGEAAANVVGASCRCLCLKNSFCSSARNMLGPSRLRLVGTCEKWYVLELVQNVVFQTINHAQTVP